MSKGEKNTAIYVAFDEHEAHDPALPERNLLRAILLTALSDLKKPGEASRKATEYFLNKDEDYIFSFQSVCNFLNIDPKRVMKVTGIRRGVLPPVQVTQPHPQGQPEAAVVKLEE